MKIPQSIESSAEFKERAKIYFTHFHFQLIKEDIDSIIFKRKASIFDDWKTNPLTRGSTITTPKNLMTVGFIIETDAQMNTKEEKAVWSTFINSFNQYLQNNILNESDINEAITKNKQSHLKYLSWKLFGTLLGGAITLLLIFFKLGSPLVSYIFIPLMTILFIRFLSFWSNIFYVKLANNQNQKKGLIDFFGTKSKKSLLDEIKTIFNFLITDFGFKIVDIEKLDRSKYVGEFLIIYRNDQSKKQIEISASEVWFHSVFRRLLNGQPANYSDKENCRIFNELAILETNNIYVYQDYFAYGYGVNKVLKNTAKLFRRNKTFFTTDIWLDTKQIKQLQDKEFQKIHGFNPGDYENKPIFFGELKKEAIKFLSANSYNLIYDSEKISPFEKHDLLENIIFSDGINKIKLTQQDWRDEYYLYNIELNDNVIFVMDRSKHQDVNEAVLLTMEKLKQCLSLK